MHTLTHNQINKLQSNPALLSVYLSILAAKTQVLQIAYTKEKKQKRTLLSAFQILGQQKELTSAAKSLTPKETEPQQGEWDVGKIRTYQKCPKCGKRFPSSSGEPIQCETCLTKPTKYLINFWYKGKSLNLSYDKDGRTIHEFKHALAVLGEIRAEIKRGNFEPEAYRKESRTTFKAFFDRFIEGYKGSIGTYDKLKAIRKHLKYFEKFQMRDITPIVVDNWWKDLQEKGLSKVYCNDILQWLKTIFKQAHELAVIDQPIRRWPKPHKIPKADIDDWLTFQEQQKILEALPEYDRNIFEFLFLTGVRVNEATGLQRSDIYRDKGVIIIRHTRKRDGSLGIVKNKKPRVIPITPEIEKTLKISNLSSSYQFLSKWNRPYSDDYLRSLFYKTCDKVLGRRVKLKNASRHSWGMNALAEGNDYYKVSKALGHSDTKMTVYYAQLQTKQFQDLYEKTCKGLEKNNLQGS
ncbi:MAG: site-specific integrase [Deltaproteobacteria bacterium]|nr:site-specific integrase [Deltaproteobacteria bacterium]MBW2026360.1 site-specific integrase [Deltaproteobacteria bacterium]MBW2125494.1 site-specific integrase [Deltaproteobacteria bacterium]